MVRTLLYSLIAVGLLVLLLLGAGSWLLYSTAGTRWLLTRLPAWSGVELQIGHIEGTLGSQLQLDDIVLNQQGLRLQLKQLTMQNHVNGWLPLSLDLQKTHLEGLQIHTEAGQQKPTSTSLQWPQIPRFLWLLRIDLSAFELRDFSWQQDSSEPFQIETLHGDFHWNGGSLKAGQVVLQNAGLKGQGSFSLGLDRPQLLLEARVNSRDPTTAWQQLQLKADLKPASDGELLRGPVVFDLAGPEGALLTAAAELGMTPDQVLFRNLHLSRPGRPGQVAADGSLQFGGKTPALAAELQLSKLDLQAETGQPLQLSGSLQLKGGLNAYQGRFDLKNQGAGWADAGLIGDFSGGLQQIDLNNLQGEWLGGIVSGHARAEWQDGWQVQAQLTGQGVNPQQFNAQLAGQLNLQVQADFAGDQNGSTGGRLQVALHDSILHGQPLAGEALLQLQDNTLQVEQLQLRGEGLLLQASGNPAERLTVQWQIERLEQLLSEAAGKFSGEGWLRWKQQRLTAEFSAKGEHLAFRQWQLDKLALQARGDDVGGPWRIRLDGQMLHSSKPELDLDRIEAVLSGSLEDHRLTLSLSQQQSTVHVKALGGWQDQRWSGQVVDLQLEDVRLGHWRLLPPVDVVASSKLLSIEPLQLRDEHAGEFDIQGRYQPDLQQGKASLRWQGLDVSLFQPWLSDWQLSGQSSGFLDLEQGQNNRVHGQLTLTGGLARQQLHLKLTHSELILDWDQSGLHSSIQLQLNDGSKVHGTLISEPGGPFNWPQQASLQLTGSDFQLEKLQPWLPPTLNITGKLDWSAMASWRADQPLLVEGQASTGGGRFYWQEDDGIISAEVTSAVLSWHWQNRLQGKLELLMREQGQIKADFDLPLAARLPLSMAPAGTVSADLSARLQELGLLTVLFPGRIQESRGQLELDLGLTGSWQQPHLQGNFHLFDSGAFLPTLGVQLKEVELQGTFAENRAEITSLQLKSGDGKLTGKGWIELQNWLPGAYRLQVEGQKFQLVNLPELQVQANPELVVEGRGREVKVRGQIKFPKILIRGKQKTDLASNSPDLVVVDRADSAKRQPQFRHDIDVQLILGDQVLLNTAGIDARLEGKIRLHSTDRQELAANGEIHVVKGKYSSYGVSLDITRGNLFFTGGPLDQPTLDILALRKSGEVQAGVKVTGTPKVPVVQLYSEPAMAETDILSYIVLGRPIDAERGQTGLLMTAAGALLSQGESASLQEKLKSRLGLDVLDISAGDGDVASSVVTTGKYLSPDLYVSLGYSLFSKTNELKVRYNLTPAWEIESSFGTESGVDMYYRIEIE